MSLGQYKHFGICSSNCAFSCLVIILHCLFFFSYIGLERVGDAQNNAYERKDVKPKISGSCFGMNKAKRIPTNKPLRDGAQFSLLPYV